MDGLIVLAAEVDGRRLDVRVRDGVVSEIGSLRPGRGEPTVMARGGALLPGLHDHHLHLLSMAAANQSVRCGPPESAGPDDLAAVLRGVPADRRWIRGIGYHESVAGILDRHAIDRMVADRPVRIQHRSGALWMLNTSALAELRLLDEFDDGRLWRRDELLRERLDDHEPPDLAAVGRRLAALGITGVTDATPNLTPAAIDLLASGALPQRVQLLGAPKDAELPEGVTIGPHKILRPDHEPPLWDELYDEVVTAHEAGRPVAIHAVRRESLILALAVLDEIGSLPGDRIEHAALVGDNAIPLLAEVGAVVVTQPGFVVDRQREYGRDIPESEQGDLYRYASLLQAGIPVVASSDAPFGSEDLWHTIAAAGKRTLGRSERVAPRKVLDGLLTPLADPGGRPRRIEIGAPADLCLLRVPLAEALAAPDSDAVYTAVCRGVVQNSEALC
ncbi:amidohydrolase family protein [Nocardia cerradoensis]|nr:amidohydrolase family protein [Nocardia cerradoensis]